MDYERGIMSDDEEHGDDQEHEATVCSDQVHSKTQQDDTSPPKFQYSDRERLEFFRPPLNVIVQRPAPGSLRINEDKLKNSYLLPSRGIKGLALIINIVLFDEGVGGDDMLRNESRRLGADKDVEHLTELLLQLNFEVYPLETVQRERKEKNKKRIQDHIKQFVFACQKKKPESIIVYVGSHGVLNTIFTSDLVSYDPPIQNSMHLYEDIIYKFSHKQCDALIGKPKIFLVQACQSYMPLQVNNPPEKEGPAPIIKDVYICMATMPGETAQRAAYEGSWFTYYFTDIMMQNALRMISLQDIIYLVDSSLLQFDQCPEIRTIGFKPHLYFTGGKGETGENSRCWYLPKKLRECLLDASSFLCILSTVDSKITCEKLEDNLDFTSYHFHTWDTLVNQPCSRGAASNLLHLEIVMDCQLADLKLLNNLQLCNHTNYIFVTTVSKQTVIRLELQAKNLVVLEDPMEWDDLTKFFKSQLASRLDNKFKAKFEDGQLNGEMLADVIRGTNPFKNTLPIQIPYYIKRTVLTRNIISTKIFKKHSSDLIAITGMDLSNDERDEIFQGAYEQDRIIQLDPNEGEGFPHVCHHNPERSVHLLEVKNGICTWQQTRGDMGLIQNSVDSSQKQLREDIYLELLLNSKDHVCISDGPGMGKTVILHRIGRCLRWIYPERTVFYIPFNEFMKHITSISKENVEQALSDILCKPGSFSKAVLKLRLKSKQISIELLLDGLDEVAYLELDNALEVLAVIKEDIKSIRIWVTTRPYILTRLEDVLKVLGHTLLKFTVEDQTAFLTSFWKASKPNQEFDQSRLYEYAEDCLKIVRSKLNDKDNDLTGIPLQCLFIGEIYQDFALQYAQHGEVSELKIPTLASSIADLYNRLIDKKIQKCEQGVYGDVNVCNRALKDTHVGEALSLIFPTRHGELVKLLEPAVCKSYIVNVGILEKSDTSADELRFIHRTFAEYFIAWFLEDRLSRDDNQYCGQLDMFLVEWVLATRYNNSDIEFVYPTIIHFFNSLLANLKDIPARIANFPRVDSEETQQHVKTVAEACALADSVNVFILLKKMNLFEGDEAKTFYSGLLLLTIENSSIEFIQLVLEPFQQQTFSEVDMRVAKEAIHRSIYRRQSSILQYLIAHMPSIQKCLIESTSRSPALLHDCLFCEQDISEAEIEERIRIIEILAGWNRDLLNETDMYGSRILSPLKWAHVKLQIKLIHLGAKVLLGDRRDGSTILHLDIYYHSRGELYKMSAEAYHSLLVELASHPDKILPALSLIQETKFGDTPLTRVMKLFDPLPDTLDLYKKITDREHDPFNVCCKLGRSPLAVAIEYGRSNNILQKLIEYGSNINWEGNDGENLLHIAAHFGNLSACQLLLKKTGLTLNSTDKTQRTPLHYAAGIDVNGTYIKLKTFSESLGKLRPFQGDRFETGKWLAKQSPESATKLKEILLPGGQTLLHVAACQKDVDSVKLLLYLGLNVSTVDCQGCTPIHLVVDPGFTKTDESPFPVLQLLLATSADNILSKRNKMKETPFDVAMRNECLDIETLRLLKTDVHMGRWNLILRNGRNTVRRGVRIFKEIEVVRIVRHSIVNRFIAAQMSYFGFGSAPNVKNYKLVRTHNAIRISNNMTDDEFNKYFTKLKLKGANFYRLDDKKNSLLHIAVKNRSMRAVKFLIEEIGININLTNDDCKTALHLSVIPRHSVTLEIVKYLIEKKANVFLPDKQNHTFLHCYANGENAGGGLPTYPDMEALFQFIAEEQPRVFNSPGGKDGATPFHIAMKSLGHIGTDLMEFMQEKGVDFQQLDELGNSLLTYAVAKNRDLETLTILIETFKLNPRHTNNNGEGLLHTAIHNSRLYCIKFFVEDLKANKLDINHPDNNGDTALHFAIRDVKQDFYFDEDKPLNKCSILIQYGADVNKENLSGETVLSIAEKCYGGEDKVELLKLLNGGMIKDGD